LILRITPRMLACRR